MGLLHSTTGSNMMPFKLANITEYQLEITSGCNASCPQCPRNINGGNVNPYLDVSHLSQYAIETAFTKEICESTKRIFFCGSYGDPIVHPDFLAILAAFRRKNPTLWLFIHTNGSVHNASYWKKMAGIIGDYGHIDFNIDGLADTNHIYRRNTDFNTIIDNAQTFINNGGKANWNFIVYKHNEHQVDEARLLSSIIGFSEFKTRSTGRFLNHCTMEEMDGWPIENRLGEQVGILEVPLNAEYHNKSLAALPKLKQETNISEYFNNTRIQCDALNEHNANNDYNKKDEGKVLINADGWVMPCNFFNHNLHDARFHDRYILPGSNDLSFLPNGKNQIQDLFSRHNAKSELNINHTSLHNIFQNSFWDEITDGFDKNINDGRIFECAMTCGEELHKVWDQVPPSTPAFLITGGNRGLGLEIKNNFNGTSIARSEDNDIMADITSNSDLERIALESLKYDVFVNCAFDGPPGEEWTNFAQVNLLIKIYDIWKENNKEGHIINIGSIGEKNIVAPEPTFERYRIAKSALAHASKQCTNAFKNDFVKFRTSLLSIDRLDTPITRSNKSWTGNGLDCGDVIKSIEYILSINSNTCIEEIVSWVNYKYKGT